MAHLYADECVSHLIVRALRALGHDVLRALEDGRANRKISDERVLTRATELNRIVITNNRNHYRYLHENTEGNHAGIITYTDDEVEALALRIHEQLENNPDMRSKLVKVTKPNRR